MLTKHKIIITFAVIIVAVLAVLPTSAKENYFKPAIGEVRSDLAGMERVTVSASGGVNLYANSGQLVSQFPLFVNGVIVTSPVLADINGDNLKEIVFIARDSGGNYTFYAYNGNKTLLGTLSLGSTAIHYDPIAIPHSMWKEEVIFVDVSGRVMRVHYENHTLHQALIIDAAKKASVSASADGLEIIVNYPNQAWLNVYTKNGSTCTFQKKITLANQIVYPVLYGSQNNIYGIDNNGRLVGINKATGQSLGGKFPVSFSSSPVDAPYWAEVNSSHSGDEMVVMLADGTIRILDELGNILSGKYYQNKSFVNTNGSAFDLANKAVFTPFNNNGGAILSPATREIASALSRRQFITSSSTTSTPTPSITINQILVYNFNESPSATTFTDSSGYNNHGSCSGSACPQAGVIGVSSTAVQFDGVNDSITVPHTASLNPTQSITIEAWVKPDFYSVQYLHTLVSKQLNYEFILNKEGQLRAGIINDSNQGGLAISPKGTVKSNVWQHLAMTYDGSIIKAYVNGVVVASTTMTGNIRPTTYPVTIGQTLNNYFFQGVMDNLVIHGRVLSESEIAAKYQPVSINQVLVYNFNESPSSTTFTDSSGYNNHGSCSGSACPQSGVIGVSSTAVQFDGVNDSITVPHTASLNPTQSITIEAWVKPDFYSPQYLLAIVSKQLNYEFIINKAGQLRAGIINDSNQGGLAISPKGTVKSNVWQHLAMTYNGSMIKAYVNGVVVASTTMTGNIRPTTYPVTIGQTLNNYFFQGVMDNLVIHGRVLSEGEIQSKYSSGS